jgi:hypothetical protein
MAKARKVEFLVDEKGRKKSVLMSYKTYMELLEDLDDLRVCLERKDEKAVPLDEVIAAMQRDERL